MNGFDLSLGTLRELNMLSIILRFALAIVCGGVIGMERGKKRQAAGLRTHLLVCIGSASIMILSQYMLLYFGTGDPARMGAQVISGIGFLGVGTIVVTVRNQVKGLTTAAGLWACACMGLSIGIGFYEGAIIMCIFIYIVLEVLDRVDDQYIKYSNRLQLYLELQPDTKFSKILAILHDMGWRVSAIEQLGVEATQCNSLLLTVNHDGKKQDKHVLLCSLRSIEGVSFVEEM